MADTDINKNSNLLCCISVTDHSADLEHALSVVGEADFTETLALQEAIMRSQMTAQASSGITHFWLFYWYFSTYVQSGAEKTWNVAHFTYYVTYSLFTSRKDFRVDYCIQLLKMITSTQHCSHNWGLKVASFYVTVILRYLALSNVNLSIFINFLVGNTS